MTVGWVTNSPEAAKALRTADRRYDRAVKASSGMKLNDRVEAIRVAKVDRAAAYDKVFKGDTNA